MSARSATLGALAQQLQRAEQRAPAGSVASSWWRDFGVNPIAMLRRAVVEGLPRGGAAIVGGVRADGLALEALRGELHAAVEALAVESGATLDDRALGAFQARVGAIAERYGIPINYRRGTPTVAWDHARALDVIDSGGGPAAHEMVHALQYLIGGVAALASAAAAKLHSETGLGGSPSGPSPASAAEIRGRIATLTPAEREAAFALIVEPMERQAYATLETGAFHATGLMGHRAKEASRYARRLDENIDAFADAYQAAAVPRLHTGPEAQVYGGIGHLARTHGETTLLCFGATAGYAQLVALACTIHPVAVAAALLPAGYLIYRAVRA